MSITLKGLTWDDPRGYGPLAAAGAAIAHAMDERLRVDWDVQPLSAFESRSISRLAPRYDLLVIDHPHVCEAAQAGLLEPVGGLSESYVGLSLESYQFAGRQWAVPVDAACQVAAYASAALDDPPTTWDEVFALSDRGLKVTAPFAGVHSLMALLSLIGSQGGLITPSFDWRTASEVELALWTLRQLCHGDGAVGLDYSPRDALSALADGRCHYVPLTFGYAHWQARGVRFASPPAWEKGLQPVTVLGGAGMAVSSFSQRREVAVRYARWSGAASIQVNCWTTRGGQPAHAATWDALARVNDFYRGTREAIDNAFVRPLRADWNRFQTDAGMAIEEWLRDGGDDASSLQHSLQSLWDGVPSDELNCCGQNQADI